MNSWVVGGVVGGYVGRVGTNGQRPKQDLDVQLLVHKTEERYDPMHAAKVGIAYLVCGGEAEKGGKNGLECEAGVAAGGPAVPRQRGHGCYWGGGAPVIVAV